MKEHNLVLLVIFINISLLLCGVNSLSIRYEEAQILYEGTSLVHYLVHYSTTIFGNTDVALRLPFILLHIASIILIYKIGKLILKKKMDRVISITLYAMLPGVNSAAILVNEAYIVIFITLLFVYLYMYNYKNASYGVLIISIAVSSSFAVLYLALFFYSIFNKNRQLLFLSLILFTISMYMYGFDTGGKPKGYFLETLGIYSAVFSIFVFLYLFYSLYRILIKEEKNILWYIAFTSLVLSLILSLRQRLHVEDFAPYIVIAIPLMVKVFFNSYRVRLPIHRKYHNIAFLVMLFGLMINLILSFYNKPLYHFYSKPHKHLAYKYHVAKELAEELKNKNLIPIKTNDEELALRLKFYGIKSGGNYILSHTNFKKSNHEKIDIKYFDTIVKSFYIYK